MAPPPPFSLGPAEVQPAPPPPPFAAPILDSLLSHDPVRAAMFLAAMRPAARDAQAQAHADLCGVGVESVRAEWGALIARCPRPALARPPRDSADSAPYDPEILALLETAAAQDLIAALSPDQRALQATAQARWLAGFGYPVAVEDLLAMWATHATDTN
ncbi:hypothetical protein EKD04_023730 [Chloroflexales bacterium ZM16-3]|nr:hypothetical protein [Chloroflexales bacterium ZM16-3]